MACHVKKYEGLLFKVKAKSYLWWLRETMLAHLNISYAAFRDSAVKHKSFTQVRFLLKLHILFGIKEVATVNLALLSLSVTATPQNICQQFPEIMQLNKSFILSLQLFVNLLL